LSTCDELRTTNATLRKLDGKLDRIHKVLEKVSQHTSLRNRPLSSTYDYVDTRICFGCGKPGHFARNCKAYKALVNQTPRNATQPRKNNQTRFNKKHTSKQSTNNNFQSRCNPSHNDGQQSRTGGNNRPPLQNNRQFLDTSNRMTEQSSNPPQQSDFRPQKPQTKGSNSSQDSFQTKSPNNVQRYSTPAEHANRDFPPNSSSAERDNAESKRPASPSSKAIAENAYAQHFGISPDNSPSGSSEDYFLAQEPPTTAEKA